MSVTLGGFESSAQIRKNIEMVLDSGHISYGPFCGEFESLFAIKHGSMYGIFTNSGTSSLQIALQAMKELYGWKNGDEVIVPALTFVATVNIIYHCGLIPVLVDVDSEYYDIDVDLIEAAITPNTRAIIPVHLFGQPAQMDRIMEIAEHYNLKVLEDSCESMGVDYDNKPVGSWGHAAAFSTYVAHIITTGVGGLSITKDEALANRMRSLANHGLDVSELPIGERYDPSFLGRKFLFTSIGHSFRGTELQAALGLAQLAELDSIIEKRQRNAQRLSEGLEGLSDRMQLPQIREKAGHSFMVYPIVLYEESAIAIREHLAYHEVESRSLLPLTTQPCYSFNPSDYPTADWLQTNGFYIGCHQGLLSSQLTYAIEMVDNYFKGIRKVKRGKH